MVLVIEMIQRLISGEKDREKLAALTTSPADLEDDFFDYSRVVIKKPWGREYLVYRNDEIALWVLYIKKGAKTSMHCHPNKKTALIILAGEARCSSLNSERILTTGHGFVIDKGVFHCTEARAPEEIVIMELETPTNKRDLVRLDDAYGRSGKAYEGTSHHLPLDDSLCHFHNDDERYHCGKKFGDCSLTVAHYADEDALREILKKYPADVILVLKGPILTSDKSVQYEVGDMVPGNLFQEKTASSIIKSGELLFIKKTI